VFFDGQWTCVLQVPKWSQPPQPATPPCYYGWDEGSICWESGQTVADDWMCTNSDPITHVRWWGSFYRWKQAAPLPHPEMPIHFHILFWTDVPADPENPDSFSHPGSAIHEIQASTYAYTCQFQQWEFDPHTSEYEAYFVFDSELDRSEWFFPEPTSETTVYWISITACYG